MNIRNSTGKIAQIPAVVGLTMEFEIKMLNFSKKPRKEVRIRSDSGNGGSAAGGEPFQ